jgi:hypothetical protein
LEILQGKFDSLNKEVEGAKATEQLATECALKAIETVDSVRKAVDAERESGVSLKAQVDMLTRRWRMPKLSDWL